MTQSLKHKLTLPLIGVLILMIVIVTGFFYFNKLLSGPLEIQNLKIDTKAALKLNVLNQISKKNGVTEWELTAASATLLKDENKAVLIDVLIVFFTKNNDEIELRSNKGILNTKTHNMIFSDNVVVKHDASILKTDKLHYNKKQHIIRSNTHVRLEKETSVIEADSMIIDLNKNTTILKGHVKGTFRENFNIL